MQQRRFIVTMTTAAACIATAAATLTAAPANAAPESGVAEAVPGRAEQAVLSEIRVDLAASASQSEVATFDRLSGKQREELASYFLDPSAADDVAAQATEAVTGSGRVRTSGDFEWGQDQLPDLEAITAGSRAASRSSWGTQWFSFAGIKLTETKVSMTYEYSGTTAKKMLGYSCTVTKNIQPFTDVATSKNSGFISGGQATAKCKVVVKRGVLTPWGTVAWSTYAAIQRLSAKGNGAITANRWE